MLIRMYIIGFNNAVLLYSVTETVVDKLEPNDLLFEVSVHVLYIVHNAVVSLHTHRKQLQ